MALLSGNRTNLESHESRTSEAQQIIRDVRSEVVQVQASVVPLTFTRNLEARIEKIKSRRFKVFTEMYRQHRIP